MKLGLQVPVITSSQSQEQLGDLFGLIAERAERAGLSSLWVMDHFFPVAGPPDRDWSCKPHRIGTNQVAPPGYGSGSPRAEKSAMPSSATARSGGCARQRRAFCRLMDNPEPIMC